MGYATYQHYKESGIKAIGVMPQHWSIRRLKFMARIQNGKDYKDVVSDEGFPVIGSGGEFARASTYLYNGESVLLGRKGTIDRPLYISGPFWTVDTMFYTEIASDVSAKYLYYCALTINFQKYATSTALPSMTQQDLGAIPFAVPNLDEQAAIARFLDFKTAQIDALIAKKQTLLEKLAEKRTALISHAVTKGLDPSVPMKDSGVEWLGEIPQHWDVWKVTHGFEKIGSGTTPRSDNPNFYDGDTLWVTTSELRESIIFDTTQKVTEEAVKSHSALKVYAAGSLAIAMYGATIGRLGILGVEATFNQACCVFSEPKVFDTRFVYYWLWMRRPILISLSSGGGQPNLSQDDLKKLWIPIPELDEQKVIVSFLDKKTDQLDSQKAKIEEVIERLQEYRSAIITNAVTGKIDVRDFRIPQPAEGAVS